MYELCDRCGNSEVDNHFRYTTEGVLCPKCFDEYITENKDAHVDDFCKNNEAGFLLTFFKAGIFAHPFTDEWWIDTLQEALDRHAELHPEEVEALKKEYAESVGSDFEDFVVEMEHFKRKEGAA